MHGKHIKYRFTPEQIDALLAIKWWEWDDEKVNAHVNLLCSSDIDAFIKSCSKTSTPL